MGTTRITTTIEFSADLYRTVKAAAEADNKSFGAKVRQLLRERLEV